MLTHQQFQRARLGVAGLTLLFALIAAGFATTIKMKTPYDKLEDCGNDETAWGTGWNCSNMVNYTLDYEQILTNNSALSVPNSKTQCSFADIKMNHTEAYCGKDGEKPSLAVGLEGAFVLVVVSIPPAPRTPEQYLYLLTYALTAELNGIYSRVYSGS